MQPNARDGGCVWTDKQRMQGDKHTGSDLVTSNVGLGGPDVF